MVRKAILLPLLLVMSFVLLSTAADPEKQLRECQQKCQQHREYSEQRECQRRCEEKYEQRRREEPGDRDRDPQRQLEQCKQRCEEQRGSRQECERRCEEKYGREEHGRRDNPTREREQERRHPYHFGEERFKERVRTEHGYFRVLEKFTEVSELLKRVENYRVGLFEANPHTFTIPHHCDADAIFYVVKGRGTITMLKEDNKQAYVLQRGDVIRVPSGTTVHITNKDNREKLQIVKLIQPVSTPGQFQEYFGAGGRNPETFFRAFSEELLEAAFGVSRDKLQRLFEKQNRGAILEAKEEQIREISRHASRGSQRPFGGEIGEGPINLLQRRPSHANQHGQIYQIDENQYRPLRDLDVAVSFANISRGSMLVPYYNSKATKIAVVVDGSGYFEMACPHVAGERTGETEPGKRTAERYQKVRERLNPGNVYVVPAGHPIATVASPDRNLEIICYDVNARDNQHYFVAGRNNIYKNLEEVEQQLSFNIPSEEVKKILNAQSEEVFVGGPQGGGRASE